MSQQKLINTTEDVRQALSFLDTYLIQDVDNDTLQLIRKKSTQEQSTPQSHEALIQQLQDIVKTRSKKMNQLVYRSKQIFESVVKDLSEISIKFTQLENLCEEKKNEAENHLYNVSSLEEKVQRRDEQIQKNRQEIAELNEKLDKQAHHFKRETKQLKKTFRLIQESTESEKQIISNIQQESEQFKIENQSLRGISFHDKFIIEQLKKQTEIQERLNEEISSMNRLLKASEHKLQWEIKKKIPLEDTIDEQKVLIKKLLSEIQDLKQSLNQYENSNHSRKSSKQLQPVFDREPEYVSQATKSFEKNILSDLIPKSIETQQECWDELLSRRNSLRKSFDEGSVIATGTNKDTFLVGPNENGIKNISETNFDSFVQSPAPTTSLKTTPTVNSEDRSKQKSPQSILVKDLENRLYRQQQQRQKTAININNQQQVVAIDKNSSPKINGFTVSPDSLKSASENKHEMSTSQNKRKLEARSNTPIEELPESSHFQIEQIPVSSLNNSSSHSGKKYSNQQNLQNIHDDPTSTNNLEIVTERVSISIDPTASINSHTEGICDNDDENIGIKGEIREPKTQKQQKSSVYASFHSHSQKQKSENYANETQKQGNMSENCSSIATLTKMTPNLYFAHFLLTSQAIKIKEDSEQLLQVDVKPLYQEILNKGVPMHIWSEWLKERMFSIAFGGTSEQYTAMKKELVSSGQKKFDHRRQMSSQV